MWLCAHIIGRLYEHDRHGDETLSLIECIQSNLFKIIDSNRTVSAIETACGALAESMRIGTNRIGDQFIERLCKMSVSQKETIKFRLKELAVSTIGFGASIDAGDAYLEKAIVALLSIGEVRFVSF